MNSNPEYEEVELNEVELRKMLSDSKKQLDDLICPCMCPNCTENAILSHLMQKGNILTSIAPKRHLYYIEADIFVESMFEYKKTGIKKVLTFKGFCNKHDTEIFKPIEIDNVDWTTIESQYLISYRSLCREIRRQELSLYSYSSFLDVIVDDYIKGIISAKMENMQSGYRILEQAKSDIELGIFEKDYSKLEFKTIVLPYKLDLCISMVNEHYIGEKTNELRILNIFPYNETTIIIIGRSKRYGKKLFKRALQIFNSNNRFWISQELSNIMIYWTNGHCISEELYNSLPKEVIKNIVDEFKATLDYNAGLTQDTENNFLVEHLLTREENRPIIYL